MAINVKLPEALVETAKRYGTIEHRSVPKQIEYWSQIGRIPDGHFKFPHPWPPQTPPGKTAGL
jgi:hypothetical protein